MPRVVIVSILILSTLVLLAFKARQSGYEAISTILFTGAGVYSLIMVAGFFGFIGG